MLPTVCCYRLKHSSSHLGKEVRSEGKKHTRIKVRPRNKYILVTAELLRKAVDPLGKKFPGENLNVTTRACVGRGDNFLGVHLLLNFFKKKKIDLDRFSTRAWIDSRFRSIQID